MGKKDLNNPCKRLSIELMDELTVYLGYGVEISLKGIQRWSFGTAEWDKFKYLTYQSKSNQPL